MSGGVEQSLSLSLYYFFFVSGSVQFGARFVLNNDFGLIIHTKKNRSYSLLQKRISSRNLG